MKRQSAVMAATRGFATRIGVGTDLKESSVTLQRARPWFMDESSGSNLAADNALTMNELFGSKRVALFGVPAPFTGTCSHEHYPPYKALAADLKSSGPGVDSIICYAVSDPYAHHGWSVALKNIDDIEFVADVDGLFAREFGLDRLYEVASLSLRSIRFSMLVDNGVVKAFQEVEDATKDAEVMLQAAKDIPK